MFTECLQNEERIIFCNAIQKVHRDLNNKIINSPILEVSIVSFHASWCTHLIAEWSFTYQSCDRSLWLVIPDHLQCFVATTINALPKASRNCRWINQMRLIVYEVCFTLASSTQQYFSFFYFSPVFSVRKFLNVQKSLGGHTQNSVTLQ